VRNTGSEDAVANAMRKARQIIEQAAARKQGQSQEAAAKAAGRGKRSI